ncbi:MAG: hypothetical protein AAFY65_12565 [Pseudomonadota bacterium]
MIRTLLLCLVATGAQADTRSDVVWSLHALTREDPCVQQMYFAITPPTVAQRDACASAFFTCEAQFGLSGAPLPDTGPIAHDLIHCFRDSQHRFLALAHGVLAQWAQTAPPDRLARRLDALARVHGRTGGQCGAAHPGLGPGYWRCVERAVLNSPLLPTDQPEDK